MINIEYSELLGELREVARDAGTEIMKIYESSFDVNYKHDGSPVTLADEATEKVILSKLKKIIPDIPIVSEENASSHELDAGCQFFLIDPLDGTKELLKKDGLGSFTVNIGLIENGVPTLGVGFAPALNRMFLPQPLQELLKSLKLTLKKLK
jgi:3'(2'), 5'-bisphosphate nucleotidase